MENKREYFKSTFAIVVASFLWGTTGTAASYAPHLNTLAIGAFSMGVGGLLLVLAARKKIMIDFKRLCSQLKLLLFGAVSVAIYPLAFYTSMRLSGVAVGTVVSIATAPLFAAILECFISQKKISRQWVLSFVIGSLGTAFLVIGRDHGHHMIYSLQQQYIGVFLGCIAGLTYAGYAWVAKRLIENGIHSQSSMAGIFGCAALLLLPSLLFTGENLFSSKINVLVPLYIAIIPMFLGYVFFAFGLNLIDASKATLITLIEPLIATILAVFVIGEKFKMIGWLGVVLVSLCLLLQTFKRKCVSLPAVDSKS